MSRDKPVTVSWRVLGGMPSRGGELPGLGTSLPPPESPALALDLAAMGSKLLPAAGKAEAQMAFDPAREAPSLGLPPVFAPLQNSRSPARSDAAKARARLLVWKLASGASGRRIYGAGRGTSAGHSA